jgi:hypothetical protein
MKFAGGKAGCAIAAVALVLASVSIAPIMAQTAPSPLPRSSSPVGAQVYFHYPIDGIRVRQRFTVRIGLKEMGVAPAGVQRLNTGHHHVLIDADLPPLDQPIPADYNHIDLGNGQTEVGLTLPPGPHTLQLLLGDYQHMAHQPPVFSKRIKIHVY